jgi:transcriptional regulator with XRE-family HTH domain
MANFIDVCIGRNIFLRRTQAGLSLKQMQAATGIARVAEIEAGQVRATALEVFRLRQCLTMSAAAIYAGVIPVGDDAEVAADIP